MGKFMLIQNKFMKLILFFFIILVGCTENLESRHNPSGFKIPLPEKDLIPTKIKQEFRSKKLLVGNLKKNGSISAYRSNTNRTTLNVLISCLIKEPY